MLFTKTSFYKKHRYPIDGFRGLKDGRRIFGDSKTYVGFLSMMCFTAVLQIIWGLISAYSKLDIYNDLYIRYENSIWLNAVAGLLFGASYMLLELPNSFIKRRLDISDSQRGSRLKSTVFFIMDQVDSMLGVITVLWIYAGFGFFRYMAYIFMGALTHLMVNLILIALKIRRYL